MCFIDPKRQKINLPNSCGEGTSQGEEDVIIEPIRSILIPGFDEVKMKCKEAGALGGGISGSGPSVFMLSKEETTAKNVEQIMKDIYDKVGVEYHTHVTTVNNDGVRVAGS